MTPTLFGLLRDAMRARYGGSVTRLAEACEVSVQLASKWVSEDERKRTVPSPTSCAKIAEALGYDATYVMQLAGHMPMPEAPTPPDPIEQMIRARTAEMRDAVAGIPREFWATIVKATFDRAIDGARDMAQLLAAAETAGPSTKSLQLNDVASENDAASEISGKHHPDITAHEQLLVVFNTKQLVAAG